MWINLVELNNKNLFCLENCFIIISWTSLVQLWNKYCTFFAENSNPVIFKWLEGICFGGNFVAFVWGIILQNKNDNDHSKRNVWLLCTNLWGKRTFNSVFESTGHYMPTFILMKWVNFYFMWQDFRLEWSSRTFTLIVSTKYKMLPV